MRPAADGIVPGILPMIGFTVTAPAIDGFAKLAAAEISVGQIVAVRIAVPARLPVPLAAALAARSPPGPGGAARQLPRADLGGAGGRRKRELKRRPAPPP